MKGGTETAEQSTFPLVNSITQRMPFHLCTKLRPLLFKDIVSSDPKKKKSILKIENSSIRIHGKDGSFDMDAVYMDTASNKAIY